MDLVPALLQALAFLLHGIFAGIWAVTVAWDSLPFAELPSLTDGSSINYLGLFITYMP